MTYHGTCDDRFALVGQTFGSLLESGDDVGASVAVVVDGEYVVDLWGGHTDEQRTTPWDRDTLVTVWSTTKTMASLAALMLIDRGDLDAEAPVARYWPEFAAASKDGVLVRHVLSHSSGVAGWDEPMTFSGMCDWERSTSLLARQAPWWEPGTASGYHAFTYGHLVGELVRRITGTPFAQFLAKEVAEPVGADFHVGLAAEHVHRTARVIPPKETPPGAANEIAGRILGNPVPDATFSWTDEWRRADLPSVNGHGNARSVALIQSALTTGGVVNGVHLLSEAGCRRATELQVDGHDLVLDVPLRFGLGYGLMPIEGSEVCFWGGWGGSLVTVDMNNRMCIAYVMNRMGEGTMGDTRGLQLVAAAYSSLAGGSDSG